MSTLNTYNLKSPDSANTNLALDASGNVAIQAGSASTPSVYVTGDANTGLYSPGSDQIALATGGTGRLFVDSSGRVGLGTSVPGSYANLAVFGTTNVATYGNVSAIFSDGSTCSGRFQHASGTLKLSSDGTLAFGSGTSATTAVTIDTSQRVGIGTTSVSNGILHVKSSGTGSQNGLAVEASANDSFLSVYNNGSAHLLNATYSSTGSYQPIAFLTGGSERGRWDTSGRFLVGTTTGTSRLSIAGTADNANSEIQITATGVASGYIGANSNGLNIGTDTAGLVFKTGVTGGGSVGASGTERMRIGSNGTVLIGKTTAGIGNAGIELDAVAQDAMFTTYAATPVYVNRTFNDGVLVDFQQDSTSEGSISVSGTTVSYNGAHLSRWSQLPGGAERIEILRGTVLSNIDEMCGWGEEDNEQLNRMKVSDVDDDPNVSGVFQAWDDDDDTYTDDFYCAMTGDFIIRIAEGVTVQRGDLLVSAGDGTARPQGDRYIKDSTVAKVTSTHVTCTYDDGSYCVPCVLMAC